MQENKKHLHFHVHCTTIRISLNLKTTQVPKDIRLDKEAVVHLQNGMLLHYKKWYHAIYFYIE